MSQCALEAKNGNRFALKDSRDAVLVVEGIFFAGHHLNRGYS